MEVPVQKRGPRMSGQIGKEEEKKEEELLGCILKAKQCMIPK